MGMDEEKHEVNTSLFICKAVKAFPKTGAVMSKNKIKVTPKKKKRKKKSVTKDVPVTCERSENIMRICVDLMPVLALAKESDSSKKEEEKEEKPETCTENISSVQKLSGQTINQRKPEKEKRVNKKSPHFVLPPLIQPEERLCQKTKRSHTPLPPIDESEKTKTPNSEKSDCSRNGSGTEKENSLPWIDNPMSSKCRSDEFCLPDISLSSLDSLLKTVTKKLRQRKRSGDEEPRGQVHFDRLLRFDTFREIGLNSCSDEKHSTDITHEKRSLPLLWSPSKPTPVLSLTKNDLLTSSHRDLFTTITTITTITQRTHRDLQQEKKL